MSLFFSRHLGALSLVAGALWIVASITAVFGNSELAGGWTVERYLLSAVILAITCLVTTMVLVGINIRATGQFDGSTLVIAVLGTAASVAALLLAWVVGGWLTLLAIAVSWTFVRARRHHAGSPVFTVAMAVALPVAAAAGLVLTVLAFVYDVYLDALQWAIYGVIAVVLVAGLVDLGVRLVGQATHSRTVAA